MVPTVGLTGGIASGKSTVARLFAALGVPVVDADQVARDVVAVGTDGLRAVAARFGERVLAPDGSLDRKALGAVVFADPSARADLNAITHPRIAAESARRLAAIEGAPYALYEAALLVENGMDRAFPALVVVAADETAQRSRAVARDGLSEDEVRARIASQLPLADKIARATFVVHNDGDLAHLGAEVARVHAALVARFALESS